MSMVRGFALLLFVAVVAGLLLSIAYGVKDGLLMALFMVVCGSPAIAGSHLVARRRARAGKLSRQFAAGVGVIVVAVTLGVGAITLLMFVSAHDALIMGLLLVFAGALTSYAASVLALSVMRDIEAVRDGVKAVGEGHRDVEIRTEGLDEIAELAAAANRMASMLAATEAEHETAEQARRDLIAAVSHDLRTPLTSLRLLADAIEDDLVDADTRRHYLAQMSGHITTVSVLVDDLFELSRLEAGDVEWSMQQVALDELIEETVEAMRPHADRKRVMVSVSLDGELVPAKANPEKLQRVLFNLIQNAIRHTPADGSVTVAAEVKEEMWVEIEVADTGEGVALEERERAFEPFFRGGAGRARTGNGTGLGLTISRAIVEAHGGEIWFADSPMGARVRFRLPVA